eukprot:510091-Amphidinium_carterae.1
MVAMMQEQEKSKDVMAVSSKSLPHTEEIPKATEQELEAKRNAAARVATQQGRLECSPEEEASKREAHNKSEGDAAARRDPPREPPRAQRRNAGEAYQQLSGNEETPSSGAVTQAANSQSTV